VVSAKSPVGGRAGGSGALRRDGAFPRLPSADNAVTPADIMTTIYHCLGIDYNSEISDHLGRPIKLCLGQVIQPLLG